MNVIVLGMHRSGTSLASGLLNLAGVYFGDEADLIPKNEENPKGFWERRDVRRLNDGLLHAQGCDWSELSSFGHGRVDDALLAASISEARVIVRSMAERSPTGVIGLKEPRMCLLMSFWDEVLQGNSLVVLVHRDPEEIAISLKHRNDFPVPVSNYLTEQYLGRALLSIQHRPALIVSHQEMIADPVAVTRRMTSAIEASGHKLPNLDEDAVRAFASRTLYRSHGGSHPLPISRRLRSWCEQLERQQLPRLSAFSITTPREVLAFEHARRFAEFTRVSTELRHKRRRVETLESQAVSAIEFGRQIDSLRAELTETKQSGAEDRRRIGELQAHLDQAQAERDAFRVELDRSTRLLSESFTERDQVQNELVATRLALSALETELDSLRVRLEQATRTMLANSERLGQALGRQRVQDQQLTTWKRQLEHQDALLGLSDQLANTVGKLQGSLSWKMLQPVLSGMLNAGLPGNRSTALPDITRLLDHYLRQRSALQSDSVQVHMPRLTSRAASTVAKLPKTALVISWDVGHNPLGRSYMLAEVLDRVFRNVVIIGFQFPRYGDAVWEPLQDSRIPVISLPGSDFPGFLEALDRIAERFDPDIVFACKARLPSLQLGALIKQRLGCPLVCDIDDHELAFFQGQQEVSLETLATMPQGAAQQDIEPYSGFWTGVAQGARGLADAVLVSNAALQTEFGGTVVSHVRDETKFDPALYSRELMRMEFGVPMDAKLVLFFGTPRKHKGIDLVAQAVASQQDPRTVLLLVGDAPDKRDIARVTELAQGRVRLLGNQPFDRIPAILAMADAVCLLQDLAHPVSAYQLPAKAIDAIAMGVPLLVSAAEPLRQLVDLGLARAVTEENLSRVLSEVLAVSDMREPCTVEHRQKFLDHFSYESAAAEIRKLALKLLQSPLGHAGFADDLRGLLAGQRRVLGVDRQGVTATDATGEDFVLFWKQNDTGLYGRRVDMFIKYLASRTDVRKVVVFDAPISEFDLGRLREGDGRPSQNRWIYIRTYEKVFGKHEGIKLSHNVFLHPPGVFDLPGRSTPGRRPLMEGYLPYIENVLNREGIIGAEAVFVIYPRNLLANEIIEHFQPRKVVVDVIDDHREWPGISAEEQAMITSNYEQLLARADMAFVNCQPMFEKMLPLTRDLRLVENGCDAHPPNSYPRRQPAFDELLAWSGQVIGYVGNLEAKIDIALIGKIARCFPHCRVVLVGSTHANERISELQALHNLVMPGVVPYDEVGAWLSRFNVAIVPHLHNSMTRSMNPLKVFVYLQCGVPVVCTDVPNIGYQGPLLRTGHDHEAFLAHVAAFLDEPPTGVEQERARFVAENDWASRFAVHIDQLLQG